MIPLTACLTPTFHEVRYTLPAPSSQPRKRRKVASSTQVTTINRESHTMSLDKTTTQPPVIYATNTDKTTLITSKYSCAAAQPGKSWVPSFLPSKTLFTQDYMSAFPSYYQDLFNDLIGYVANAKPILIQGAYCSRDVLILISQSYILSFIADVVSGDPWQFMIAVKLLNVTTGRYAIPIFWKLTNRWPTPHDMINGTLEIPASSIIPDIRLATKPIVPTS